MICILQYGQLRCFILIPLFQMRKFGQNNYKAGNGPGLGFGPFGHGFGLKFGNDLGVQGVYVDEKLLHRILLDD